MQHTPSNPTHYFISDTHFDADRPQHIDAFEKLCQLPQQGDSLLLLGDIFEVWTGDDTAGVVGSRVEGIIKDMIARGIGVYFMHGNRDFLVGKSFAKRTGCNMLPDPSPWVLPSGMSCSLTHGDSFCTHDKSYRRFRNITRNRFIQKFFLLLPKQKRLGIAHSLRQASLKSQSSKSMMLLDANEQLVEHFFDRISPTTLIIMGHTHRPNIHTHLDRHRVVLGDWHQSIWYGIARINTGFELYKDNFSLSARELRFSLTS